MSGLRKRFRDLADSGHPWLQPLLKAIRQMQEGEVQLVAAALSFWTILAIVPFLAVTFVVFKSFGGLEGLYPKAQALVFESFKDNAGENASLILQKIFTRLTQKGLGFTGAFVLFITSIRLLHHIEYGVNKIWRIRIQRPWWKRILLHLLFFTAFPLGLAVYAGLKSLQILEMIPGTGLKTVDFALFFVSTLLINRALPSSKVGWRPALIASALSAAALSMLDGWFAAVTKQLFYYNKVYGSLAALPLLALWILMMWQIILAGVAIAASLQDRQGPPVGARSKVV